MIDVTSNPEGYICHGSAETESFLYISVEVKDDYKALDLELPIKDKNSVSGYGGFSKHVIGIWPSQHADGEAVKIDWSPSFGGYGGPDVPSFRKLWLTKTAQGIAVSQQVTGTIEGYEAEVTFTPNDGLLKVTNYKTEKAK